MMKPVVLVVAVLLLSSAWTKGCYAQDRCQYYMNYNVTSRDICAPVFSPSAYDCCRHCTEYGPACVAAVYNNMECHFKNVTMYAPSVGGVVIVPQRPPATTSAVPVTTTTTSPTTTPQPPPPTTSQAPPVPTATSTAAPSHTYGAVTQVRCLYSNKCSIPGDSTCVTSAFFPGVCYSSGGASFVFQCLRSFALMMSYTLPACKGSGTSVPYELNKCIEDQAQDYIETMCLKSPSSTSHGHISRRVCQSNCTSGCTTTVYKAGECYIFGDKGEGMYAEYYPLGGSGNSIALVVYTQYPTLAECQHRSSSEGNKTSISTSWYEPVDECWTTGKYQYITVTYTA